MMKLWLLKARDEELPDDDNPWVPRHDKTFGVVVRAKTEKRARKYAQSAAKDEKNATRSGNNVPICSTPWIEKKYASCVELTGAGEGEVILIDSLAG